MKKVTITLQDREMKMLEKLGGKYTPMAQLCMENFLYMQRIVLHELKGKFNENELKAMLDSFNGTMYSSEWAVNKTAFIAHTEDSEKFDGIDEKWKIDTSVLVKKLNNLSAGQILTLQFELYRFWDIQESYNKDLNEFVKTFI